VLLQVQARGEREIAADDPDLEDGLNEARAQNGVCGVTRSRTITSGSHSRLVWCPIQPSVIATIGSSASVQPAAGIRSFVSLTRIAMSAMGTA